ncbi:FAD-dependent oxidoreductase [Pseudonocardia sulfidoxydans NBRC 16205]|uniref:FAD-dependent oxidoreductase n=1 Tax=Pseudonocardia sulfidoxydans NBRC 16205 TaxID=1223511 RepID=A0A511DLS1_9PSEU|nr:FAD-dependent oxidoreductase [Pseudonocardia sulfidoxydans]GEL25766.1 FAD-dependent oxidoreductase [Pseudonocardia sulfidoxydans NBRC 16205]
MEYDVVVVGAGPVGLLLACELRLGGVEVLVLEREDRVPATRFGPMGARSVNSPTVHALHLRGLLPAVAAAALTWIDPADLDHLTTAHPAAADGHEDAADAPSPPFVGHFAGIPVRADRLRPPEPGTQFLGAGVVAQGDLETILAARAAELGVEVRRGHEVTGVAVTAGGAEVTTGKGVTRARWLVGTDGGRSLVRRAAGFDFPGVDPVFTGRQALVDLAEPDVLVAGGWQTGHNGAYAVGGFGTGAEPTRVHVVEHTPPAPRDSPVTTAELQDVLRRVSGTTVTIEKVHVATRYADTTRQASTYRCGRVLLCGDAAHVHSPAGGQGMNLGLGDAMNLGWKLAAVARGDAPAALLDSYTAERHPVGVRALRWSLAQTALSTASGPRADALRDVVADLLDTPDGATYVVSTIGGDRQCYDAGAGDPRVGSRVSDVPLGGDGTTIAAAFHAGRAVLVDPADACAGAAAPWKDRLTLLPGPDAATGAGAEAPPAVLVRPDGYLAWVGADTCGLPEALTRWLGPRHP